MAITKYNRPEIKLEFFSSDFMEVKPFMESEWYGRSWNINQHTRGWWKEKAKYMDRVLQKAITRNSDKQAKSLKVTMEFLQKAKKNALIKIAKQITEDNLISMKDLVRWLGTIKTELWEPTRITKNENNNNNTEELSDDDKLLLEKIFGNKNADKSNWKDERKNI